MRYTHGLRIIRHRKHAFTISLAITGLLIFLILIVGFTILDARQFFFGFLESLSRVTISYAIALILAVILSLVATSSKTVENITLPILDVLQSFPAFALFPLFVIWFGKASIVTILILIITMIWPIVFTIIAARKQIREDIFEAAAAFGAKRFNFFIYVLFPLLYPSIVTGSIVAWGEAWEAIIAAEIIVSVPGVGTYLAGLGEANKAPVLIIGVTLLLMILFILNKYIWLELLNNSTKYQQE